MHGTAVSVHRRRLIVASSGCSLPGAGIAATTLHGPFWHEFTATEFEVQSRSDVVFAGIDGEPVELATPLRFEIHPGGLTMLVPRGNVEAAQRRSERDVRVRDLVDVALGREPRRYVRPRLVVSSSRAFVPARRSRPSRSTTRRTRRRSEHRRRTSAPTCVGCRGTAAMSRRDCSDVRRWTPTVVIRPSPSIERGSVVLGERVQQRREVRSVR